MKRILFVAFLYLFSSLSLFSQVDTTQNFQFKSFNLIKLDLVGVNTTLKPKKLKILERFFEKAHIRVFPDYKDNIQISPLEIPKVQIDNELTYLQRKLVLDYYQQHFNNDSRFTVFVFNQNVLNTKSWVNEDLSILFVDEINLEKNIIEGLSKIFKVEVKNEWIDSLFLEDSLTLHKIEQYKYHPKKSPDEIYSFNSTGLVNVCTWEEDDDGNLLWDGQNPMSAIRTHYKQNTAIKYLDPSNWFFKPLFVLFDIKICLAHILVVLFTTILLIYLFWKIGKIIAARNLITKTFTGLLRLGAFLLFILGIGFSFYLIDLYYQNHYVKETKLNEMDGSLSSSEVLSKVGYDINFEEDTVTEIQNQILKKRNDEWYIQRGKSILIFRINDKNELKFHYSKDEYSFKESVKLNSNYNHYYVFEKMNEEEEIESVQVFSSLDHEEITHFEEKKSSNKVLLFVNGYRSIITNSKEFKRSELLKRLAENKSENSNTKNKIFDLDIYDYWTPWNDIDKYFIHKIQPSFVLFADGHHSISSSNYNVSSLPIYVNYFNNIGNLGYFGFVAQNYPEPCSNLDNHSCKYVKIPRVGVKNSWELLPNSSNYQGFQLRKYSGRIAGKNLLQSLNNHNRTSSNDTIFIVCHSMGFAYAQGIIDEIRGKINFGGYYIIAPENPSAGYVNQSEWKETWHYGSDESVAECLQDGIAPQTAIKGIENRRVFFPKNMYPKLGFSSSHFVGNYTWIFDIKPNHRGYINSH